MSLSDLGLLPKITASHSLCSSNTSLTLNYLHPLAHTLFCHKFRFESPNIAACTSKAKQSNLPSRAQLIAWFDSLSREELTLATAIDNADFIEKFLKKYQKHPDALIHLPSCRTYPLGTLSESGHPSQFLKNVRVAMMADPLLYLQTSYITGEKVLEWMDSVSKGRIFDLPHRSLNRENPQQNLLWFNSATFHPLMHWLVNELQKSILRYYFNPKDRLVRLKTLIKYINDKKSTKMFAPILQFTLEEIRGGALEEKDKLIESFRNLQESIRDELEQSILSMVEEKKRKKKKRPKKDKQNQKQQTIQMHQQKLVEKQSLLVDYSHQTKPLLSYKLQIISTVTDLQDSSPQKQTPKHELLQSSLTIDNQKEYSQIVELDFLSFRNFDNVACEGQSTSYTLPSKNEDPEIIHDDPVSQTLINSQSPLEDSFQTVRLNRKSSHQLLSNFKDETTQDHLYADNFATNEGGEMKTRRKRKRKSHKSHNKVVDDFKEKVVTSILNKQFTAMVDSLSTESNNSFQSKAIAFERVRYFVKSLYSLSEAVLYGSNAVGLALPTSDIDVMLVQMNCQNKEQVCDALAQIAIYINTMGWVTSCSTLFNAKVPVLKLQIDPSITYFTPKRKSNYFGISNPYLAYYLDLKDPEKATPIKVDITISTEDGKISGSTELMRYWLNQKPSMQRVLLALKYSLSVRGYSQNFKGGIGSYCLFVMVAAYFLHFKQSREQFDCEILLDILRFYGQDFQNQMKIVSMVEQDACFIDNEQGQLRYEISDQILFNNLLKIIDPLNNKLMSSSCLQYNNIKVDWRHIRSQILKVEQLVQNQIEVCFHSSADIAKLMTNKKGVERWINKLQSRIDFSITEIMSGQR